MIRIDITEEGSGLERSECFEAFASRDGKGATLVRASQPSSAFGNIEHGALRGAKSFITKLGIAYFGSPDREQQFDGDVIRDESIVWELRRPGLVGHAPFAQES